MPRTTTSSMSTGSYVKEATVGRAFAMKRFHARGRGRSAPIEKYFANLLVVVRERAEAERRRRSLMGQKVNPIGLRLGINRTWDSRWFARKDYSKLLHEDLKLREFPQSSGCSRRASAASSSSAPPRRPASPSIRPAPAS